MNYIFTSESVTEGHPDKICDKIADSILDEALSQDAYSKMAVEATIKDELILIYGEANTNARINYENIAKNVLKEIGYTEDYKVIVKINKQSREIENAITNNKDKIAAGDQGIMFGFACNETDEYMPAPIYFANKLAKQLDIVRRKTDFLKPDGKTQVSVEYKNNKVFRISTVVISIQHEKNISKEKIEKVIINDVIKPIISDDLVDEETRYFINPSGSFVQGGSYGDSGTTGRKIVCDTYGGVGRIGGGCFSSKDPTKVDRSGAYYCRYVAKNLVANNLVDKCEIQVAYAIGENNPISLYVNTFDTEKISMNQLLKIIADNFDFRVSNIIAELQLRQPIYKDTACYGHFGNPNYPWEKIKKLINVCVKSV